MQKARLSTRLDRWAWIAWLVMLVTLPLTSQPHVAELVGGRPVGPLAILPLVLVLFAGVLPHIARRGRLPGPTAPLLLFACVAALGVVLSPWLGLNPFKGQEVLGRGIRALVTVAIGVSFYLAAVLLPADRRRLRASLGAVMVGAIPMLLWSTVQLWFILDGNPLMPQWADDFQDLLSLRGLYLDRVTGMAYEPSWLADQLVILYLPLWLGCILAGVSVFRRRLGPFSLEHGLLAWGMIILMASFSRIGIAAWGVVVGSLAILGGWKLGGRLAGGLVARSMTDARRAKWLRGAFTVVILLVLVAVAVAMVVLLGQFDARIARVLDLDFDSLADSRHPVWYMLANRLKYAERVIYWTAAARTFALYPALGVGVGNSGFLFRDVAPAFGYLLPEILVGLNPGLTVFPNAKSLWFRLLAETGVVGTSAFLTWLIVVAASAWAVLRRDRRGLYGGIAAGCLLSLIALIGEGFSLDTFALPYMWLLPGMATAGWVFVRAELGASEQAPEGRG